SMSLSFTRGQLAERLGARCRGDPGRVIRGLASLQDADENELSFLANAQYRKQLAQTRAAAVLLAPAEESHYDGDALFIDNPYLAYARLSHLFDRKPVAAGGIQARKSVV